MAMDRTVVVRLVADTTGFSSSLGRAAGQTATLKQQLGGTGKAMTGLRIAAVGAAVGVAGAVAGSISAYAEFDDKLNQSLAIMGDVSDEMRTKMSDAAREVGRETRFGAEEAAEAFYFLASAGLDAQQSIAAMPQVAAFAQAGMFDLARATDLATDAQSALGLTVPDAERNLQNLTRVTDVLVKANTLANASVEQFSESLTNKAGAALKLLGKDVEEGVAVLAAFADQGVKGTEAGERLNIVLRDLQTASIKNRDTWDELGLSVYDSSGEMRNIADIVEDLEGTLAGASDETARMTLMQLGFQDRSVSAIMTLLGLSDSIRTYEEELRSAGGTTAEVADKQLQSFSAKLDLLKGQLKDAGLELGESLAPAMDGLIEALPQIVDGLGALATAIGPALAAAFGGIADYVDLVGEGFLALTSIWNESSREALRFKEASDSITQSIADGAQPAAAYANAINHLASSNSLTEDSFKDLAKGVEFVGDQYLVAIREVRDFQLANDGSLQSIAALNEELYTQARAMIDAGEATEDLYGELGIAEYAAQKMAFEAATAAEATEEAGDAAADAADGFEDGAEGAATLADELDAAADAQQSLADVLKAAADPVFAAVSAVQTYAEAMDGVNDISDLSAEKQLELAETFLDTQSALDALTPDQLQGALTAIGTALGMTTSDVRGLLVELGVLNEEGDVITVVDVNTAPAKTALADYIAVLDDVGDATDLSVADQERLDEAIENLSAEVAAMDASQVEAFASRAAEDLGIAEDRVRELLDGLRLLDGQNVNASIEIRATGSGLKYAQSGTIKYAGPRGARAAGGPVAAGSPYLVGERGPELFVPDRSGTIVPNRDLSSGGDQTTNRTVVVNFNNPSLTSDPTAAVRQALAWETLEGRV